MNILKAFWWVEDAKYCVVYIGGKQMLNLYSNWWAITTNGWVVVYETWKTQLHDSVHLLLVLKLNISLICTLIIPNSKNSYVCVVCKHISLIWSNFLSIHHICISQPKKKKMWYVFFSTIWYCGAFERPMVGNKHCFQSFN